MGTGPANLLSSLVLMINAKLLILFILAMANQVNAQDIVIEFSDNNADGWWVVNDGVMGGLSKGEFKVKKALAIFSGHVSTDNNGGFTMVRKQLTPASLLNYTSFVLVLKGDGKSYQFRVKSDASQRHSYVYSFSTNQEWQEIEIPFADLEAKFRGRNVDIPNYKGENLEEIAFLIGNKVKESFELTLKEIRMK